MFKIPQSDRLTKIERINKGWSNDEKYYLETISGDKWLLRLSDSSLFKQKNAEFEAIKKLSTLSFLMSNPIDFGMTEDGKVYSLFSWTEGKDAERVLPQLSEEKHYHLGLEAGQILKVIHSFPAPDGVEDWQTRYNRKIDQKIKLYNETGIHVEGEKELIQFIHEHRHLLKDRPQALQHGDYHVGNLLITSEEKIAVIDFNRLDYGDPWEEFNRIIFCTRVSPSFASGMVDGYFNHQVPSEFWSLMTLYMVTNAISSIPWAIPYGDAEIQVMKENIKDLLNHYQYFKFIVPSWYKN
jgi:aminoglycoside phosphotransferase (APT) family kinase protein